MVRTQIQLTEEQAARVRRLAAQRGKSFAAVIRDAVDQLPDDEAERQERFERALHAVRNSTARSGIADLAREHDREYAAILAEEFGLDPAPPPAE
jgi:Arc/MetJ-type ribon-helix-helix transcriptional regulator